MKKNSILILGVLVVAVLGGCTAGNCRRQQGADPAVTASTGAAAKTPENPMTKPTERVRVFKYDGSLQCNQGKAIPLETMRKELKDIEVFASENKADSLMRIQRCGAPTGRANVFEIAHEDLDAAKKLGFQLWTFD